MSLFFSFISLISIQFAHLYMTNCHTIYDKLSTLIAWLQPLTALLQLASQIVWQTSAPGHLRTTWSSTSTRLSSFLAGEGLPAYGPTGNCWGCCGASSTSCEEPWRHTGWPTELHSQHHRGDPILQICSLLHPLDPTLPHEGSSTALGPSTRHLPPRLLQLTPGWTPCLRDQAFATHPELGSTTRVQPAKVLPRDPSLPRPPLAPCSSLNLIQESSPGPRLASFLYYPPPPPSNKKKQKIILFVCPGS